MLITDYICGPYHLHSKHFKQYIAERGYTLLTVEDYGKVFDIQNLLSHILICFQTLENVGFKNVQAIDKTDQFLTILQKELNKFESEKNSFLKVNYDFESYERFLSVSIFRTFPKATMMI